jgi:hypothetical protein
MANVFFVAKVSVQKRNATGGFELAGDTDLTSKYCTFIDWQQSLHSRLILRFPFVLIAEFTGSI